MKLAGKHCLVTGANSGLGLAVSKKLAGMGANTILVCRSRAKGEAALQEIKRETPDASLELMTCDLSSMKSIRSFLDEFRSRHSKLDVLFNNAAVMKQKRTLTEDGFEMMFQVNYLAPFILMNSLLDLLRNGSEPLVIGNARPEYKIRLDMDDLQFEKRYKMYGSFFQTKLCLLFACLELAHRPESDGVAVTMLDPGPFKSNLVRDVPLAGWFKNLFSVSVDKAADNILHHITSDDVMDKNGKVFKEKQDWPLSEYWQDAKVREPLWAKTQSIVSSVLDPPA
ncbi:MAG: SDR family NAD(P)-dependent oxidoreductase [candidate division WOR-3 bacterium]|nr:MAG: SDR family NAD(P)-dependent oxidoreductase [candidate division WOR-3 bacterium]